MTTQPQNQSPTLNADPSATPAPIVSVNPSHAPDASPVIQLPPSLPPPAVQVYSAADLERVRQEEKQKLYGQQEQLKNENKQLKAQLTQSPSDDQQLRTDNVALKQQVTEMAQQMNQLVESINQERTARRYTELSAFMERRIRETQSQGYGLIIEMVGGQNEQEIEQSLYNANQAFIRYFAQAPAPTPSAVSVRAAAPSTNGFPTAPNAAPVVEQGQGTPGFIEAVKQNTTPEAIRNGSYAANRQQMLEGLRASGAAVGGALMNTPRMMPGPQQPTTTWANVQQPQGLPTMPAQQPGMPYQQPMIQQPPQQMPAQNIQDARNNAINAASRHLSNPQGVQAPNREPERLHSEYGARPNGQVSFTGQHPMIRST